MGQLRVATIGFTKSTAARFFGRLHAAGVKRVLDVRLNNTSQLAGFAKSADLVFFLDRLHGIDYRAEPLLAPTAELLRSYRKQKTGWDAFADGFGALMAERAVQDRIDPEALDGACLLCSEPTAHRCHRRLVCDYLNEKWNGSVQVEHL